MSHGADTVVRVLLQTLGNGSPHRGAVGDVRGDQANALVHGALFPGEAGAAHIDDEVVEVLGAADEKHNGLALVIIEDEERGRGDGRGGCSNGVIPEVGVQQVLSHHVSGV